MGLLRSRSGGDAPTDKPGAPPEPLPAVTEPERVQADAAKRAEEVGFVRAGFASMGETVREAAKWGELRKTPYGLTPAMLLGFIFFVSAFANSVFSLALPDIVRDLEINAVSILAVQNMVGFVLIFATIGLAYALDRMKRIPFFAGGVIFNGLMSIFAGRSNTIWQLGVARVGDSISETASGIPIFSLAADYYPVETRGRMFAFIGTLSRVGSTFAPLVVGIVVAAYSWRLPYFVSGPLLVALGVVALLKLREPIRGYMERKALGLSEEEARMPERAPSFGEAWRTIWGIRTLRRLFIGGIAAGVGSAIILRVYSLYLDEEYGMDASERGLLIFVGGIFSLVGGFIGGGIVDRLFAKRPQRVLVFTAVLGIGSAIAVGLQAAKPPVFVLYVIQSLFGFFYALTGPARSVFYAQILPANLRTAGLGVFALADIPVMIVFAALIARVPEWGFRGMIVAAVPFLIAGNLIDLSASGLFERDMRNALLSQQASREYRRAKEEGRLKLLVCRGVEVEYGSVQVLFGVDFEVEQGEIVALLGANGAGKSTLLKAIAGVSEASGGAIVLDGRDITHVPPHEIAQAGVVLMPGGKGVFPGLTVRENLALGTWGCDEEESKKRLDEVLDVFPALRAKLNAHAGTMSGGEQQMLALAMAFLAKPTLLLIDELSLGLAPAVVQELLESVRAVRDRGVTVVLVEQSVNVALTVAERAVFMEKGEVKFSGKTKDLLNRPDILRAVYVKGAAAMGARTVTSYEAERLQHAPAILQVQNVAVAFGGVRALNDVSFDLRDGEILGIVGPNGAGKTTLFDVISGFVRADRGAILLEGQDVTNLTPDARSRLQLVRRFQDARLYPSLTVYETLLMALDRHHKARSVTMTSLQLPAVRASERALRRRADELIALLGLGAARDKFVREISTGMRRIVDLACVVASEPKVLLLDEPSSGIAQAEAEAMAPLLRRVRDETGCAMLLIEHDMPLISRTSDELLAMVQGEVVTRGPADQVLSDPRVVQSYLGTSEEVIKRSGVLV